MTTTSSIAHHHPADPVRDHHEDEHHDDHGPEKGWRRWVFATNHKDIGTMYLLFSLLMFFVGGTMAMVIRAELFKPGLQLVDPMFFNSMTSMHALIMIFGAVMPAFVGLANWMICFTFLKFYSLEIELSQNWTANLITLSGSCFIHWNTLGLSSNCTTGVIRPFAVRLPLRIRLTSAS